MRALIKVGCSCAVAGDSGIPEAVNEHLIHAPGAKGGLEDLCDDLRCHHVGPAGVPVLAPFGTFLRNQNWLTSQISQINARADPADLCVLSSEEKRVIVYSHIIGSMNYSSAAASKLSRYAL
jgi:hypothetical protein